MADRIYTLTQQVYVLDEQGDFDEGENIGYFRPYKRVRSFLYGLTEGRALYLDMLDVVYVDDFFASLILGDIQHNKSAGGERDELLWGKQLIVMNASSLVLGQAIKSVESTGTCFMHLMADEGILRVKGKSFLRSKVKVRLLEHLLSGRSVTAEQASRDLANLGVSEPGIANHLREMANWGLISSTDIQKISQGRPQKLYLPYFPEKAVSWEINGVLYERE